jgi:hypothetical protein
VRTFLHITTVAISIAAAFLTSHSHAQWPGTTRGSDHNNWLEIGGRAYSRPGTDSDIPVVTDSETGATLFDAGQATNAGSAPGLEVSFGFEGKKFDRNWEFRTVIADFDVETDVPGPNLASPFFGDADIQNFNYQYGSRLLSFELNSWRSLAPGIRFSAGPRYVSLTDTVTAELTSTTSTGVAGAPLIPIDTVSTREATNGLIGLQAGLDLRFPISQQIYTTGFLRTGGYYNPTEVNSSLESFSAGVLFDSEPTTRQTKSTGSFLAEVGGRIYVDLYEDTISSYVGYEATWIDGIALAPPAFFGDGTSGVDTANTLFFHAVTFGIRMNF